MFGRFHIGLAIFLVLLVAALCGGVFAAEGIDSDTNTDLPLNARGVLVATLRATASVSGSGMLDIANGVKIGTVGDELSSDCKAHGPGVMRYNTKTNIMEYCNGNLWKTASSSGSNGSFLVMCSLDSASGYPYGWPVAQSGIGSAVCSSSGQSPSCQEINKKTGGCFCPAGSDAYVISSSWDPYAKIYVGFECR